MFFLLIFIFNSLFYKILYVEIKEEDVFFFDLDDNFLKIVFMCVSV